LAKAAVAVCTAIYFLDGLIHTILGPLAPDIARSLSLGNAELGPIFSSNLAGQCIGLVVFPAIASRFGHRLTVTLAVVGFAVGQAASALADDGTSLFAIRLITGIFLGGCLPSCLAIVTAQAPPKRRGLSILVLFTGYGLGAAVAGIVAAGFADFGGWRAAMVAVGTVSLLAAAAAWLSLRDDQAAAEVEAQGAASGRPAALQILGSRYWFGTAMLWLLFVVMLTISYCLNSWLPIMLVEVGHDEAFAALSITIFGFGGAIAALGVGLLIDRFGCPS
jgi:MFS family permease